jgi:hypothetical protein
MPLSSGDGEGSTGMEAVRSRARVPPANVSLTPPCRAILLSCRNAVAGTEALVRKNPIDLQPLQQGTQRYSARLIAISREAGYPFRYRFLGKE